MAFAMTSYSLGARATLPRAAMNGNSRACVLTPRRSVRVLASQDPIDQASEKVEEAVSSGSAIAQEASSTLQEAAYTPVQPEKAPSFGEAMSFAGPAPEIINGRLAMLAFLAASGAELATGAPVAAQLREAPILVALTFVAFSAASLIPILRGAKLNKAVGPFNPTAELLNGRAAMLGFVLLLSLEWAKGGALL